MLTNQKELFSLPEGINYINCAYMAPLLKAVEDVGIVGIQKKRNPIAVTPEDFFTESDDLRKIFSELINNPNPSRIAIIPSVSYGMANVTRNIKFTKGDEILVAGNQFPSNYYPWKQLAEEAGVKLNTVYPPEELKERGRIWNEKILDSINEHTRVVAIGHVHWADGTKFELKAIKEKLTEHGGLLIIDGTQSVGALPFDVQDIKPDALICAGYKWLMGPYALGLAYYGDYFDKGVPVEHNWINRKDSQDFANLVNYRMDFQPGALRYEVGEHSNFILVPMLKAALEQITKWQIPQIQAYCKELITDVVDELRDNEFYIEEEKYRGNHLFGIYLPSGMQVSEVKEQLEKQKIYVSVRGASVRISPHLYNSKEDLVKLKEALLAVL